VLARVGGDEFVLLMRAVDVNGSRQAVQRVLDTIALPFDNDAGEPLTLTASIGATVYPTDRADAETLLRHAGHALWGVKQAGRNAFQFFDAERHRQSEARFSALGRMQEAFDADEFCLYFQPKVDMRRGKVLGAEALIRWAHPERGILPPGEFLPVIENTPLAVDLGTWVLRKGVEQLAHWHRLGLEMTLSVNVSARLLQEPQFGKYVAGLLQRHRAPIGRKLILEVLETAALKDMERTSRLMDECHALGVRFALDDFGTGFSNLTYLRQLPVDMLKIDRSFVANMLADKEDLAIVEGVLTLARTFGCTVVAEGVETAEQARRLIRMGCDIGQGYGIAPPMPMEQLLAWAGAYKGMEGVAERRPAEVAR
jgi:EAL domain-containing protein (putative c-di-GMP-specific phosphodiesterase class I)